MIAFIPGVADDHAFIQVIAPNASHYFTYPLKDYARGETIRLGKSSFSKKGISIDIQKEGIRITGQIQYMDLTPLRYDIMGIFKYLPMECRHGIVSLHHRLDGCIDIDGESMDFTGGVGYIEKDSGTSFPKAYTWVQCSAFPEKCSVIASVAHIPFLGMHFKGCICVVYYQNKEYRLATYLGVKIIRCDRHGITLKQGNYRLEIEIVGGRGQRLLAPKEGQMARTILESAACNARFRFFKANALLFDFESSGASFECVLDERIASV